MWRVVLLALLVAFLVAVKLLPWWGTLALLALTTSARLAAQTTQPAHTAAPAAASAGDESKWLKNIRQLTSKNMGLDRSGEAYFSRDVQRIRFQA